MIFWLCGGAELNFVEAVLFVESDFAFELELGFVDGLQKFLERFLVFEVGLLFEAAFGQQFDQAGFAQAAAQLGRGSFVFLHVQQELVSARAFEVHAFFGFDDVIFGGALHQLAGKFALVANVAFGFAALHAIERRLRDVDVAALDQFLHVAEEKREQQRADVAAVDVGVGHENDFVVAELAGVEIVFADAGAERGDDGANFFVAEHFVVARLFDVEDFALERQDGLIFAVAAHFGGAAGGFSLDDEEFAARRIAFLAIGELAGQAAGIHGGFAAGELARFAGGFAGAGGVDALADDAARDGGVLVKPLAELFVDELLDVALDVAIELALGLAFELGLRQAHADDGDETFAHVVAGDGDFVFLLLEHAGGGSEIVDGARERGAEAGKVRAAIDGVDGVGEGKDVFAVGVVVLQRDFDFDVAALAFHVDGRIVERGFAAIQVLDEFGDAAGEAELGGFLGALVGERDFQALVKEG